jgi:hypothetical protein
MNFIPSIIYVQIFILWSLFKLTLYIILPFIFPTKVWKGKKTIITHTIKIPGQPKRATKIAIIPAKAKGATKEAKNRGAFV